MSSVSKTWSVEVWKLLRDGTRGSTARLVHTCIIVKTRHRAYWLRRRSLGWGHDMWVKHSKVFQVLWWGVLLSYLPYVKIHVQQLASDIQNMAMRLGTLDPPHSTCTCSCIITSSKRVLRTNLSSYLPPTSFHSLLPSLLCLFPSLSPSHLSLELPFSPPLCFHPSFLPSPPLTPWFWDRSFSSFLPASLLSFLPSSLPSPSPLCFPFSPFCPSLLPFFLLSPFFLSSFLPLPPSLCPSHLSPSPFPFILPPSFHLCV